MANERRGTRARGVGARRTPAARGGQLTIPYEYAASFELTGQPGTQIESAISTSVDGVFVATAIGYSVEAPDTTSPLEVQATGRTTFFPWGVTLERLPQEALVQGFRLSREGRELMFDDPTASPGNDQALVRSTQAVGLRHRATVLETAASGRGASFLFSMVDTATGRELQDEPIHNLAGLGGSEGQRPFRRLARPMVFQPRSTIRLQIVELDPEARGTLFVVLFGYKVVDLASCGTEVGRLYQSVQDLPGPMTPGRHAGRVIPFDYVASLRLTGRPGARVEEEVPINVDGAFVATSIGYGLQPDVGAPEVRISGDPVNLRTLQLESFRNADLLDGVRLRPDLVRLAFDATGSLRTNVPAGLLPLLFERTTRPVDVSFRYTFFDTGTGRELQNRPIHNVAGLGSADGDRPFKVLARPLVFLPRSSIRLSVEERRGRGRLFIVFQGYKLVTARRAG